MSLSRLHRITFLILLEACLCFHVHSRQTQPRIVGGDICNAADYPFMVALQGPTNCGGSLITLEWVLTAGHCLKVGNVVADSALVRSGFNLASRFIQMRNGTKIIVHKQFDYDKMEKNNVSPELRYDIGLVLVNKPFKVTATLNVIALPKPGFTQSCHVATVMGTGVEHIIPYGREHWSKPLKCVDLNIVNQTECKKSYLTSVVDDTLVCTLEMESGKDACYGDSGGPLVCRKTLIGIVSFGRGCGNAGMAATYTKVESYLDFIKKSMKERPKAEPRKESGSGRKESGWKLLCIIYLLVKYLF